MCMGEREREREREEGVESKIGVAGLCGKIDSMLMIPHNGKTLKLGKINSKIKITFSKNAVDIRASGIGGRHL